MNKPPPPNPYVRCPFCPDKMRQRLYEQHFAQLHAVDVMTGRKVPYVPPLDVTPTTRKKITPTRDTTDHNPLFP